MVANIYLSTSALLRLIKLRLLGEFRPVDEPFPRGAAAQPCFMDGITIVSGEVRASPRVVVFQLNRLGGPGATLAPEGQPIGIAPVAIRLSAHIHMAPATSVRAASVVRPDSSYGLPDRPDDLKIVVPHAEFDMFFSVSPAGVPTLQLQLQNAPPPSVAGAANTLLQSLGNLGIPFPVGAAFAEVLPKNRTRVLNAGIAWTADGVVIRLEFETAAQRPAAARLTDWLDFFAGHYPSLLNGQDWAFEVPTQEIVRKLGEEFDDQFKSGDLKKHFTSLAPAWCTFSPGGPSFDVKKYGALESICAGIDIKTEVSATAHLSVPAPNTMRVSVEVDWDLDDWDTAKCVLLSLLNPIGGFVTAFDKKLPWYAGPVMPLVSILAALTFGLFLDDVAIAMAIGKAEEKAAKDGGPIVVQTSLNTFYVDIKQEITTAVTRDWLVIEQIAGIGDRLVLRGSFTAPDVNTLPRLQGQLADRFGCWSRRNRCSSNTQWFTVATVKLDLMDTEGQPVYHPVIPVRYGVNLEKVGDSLLPVGQVTWRIIEDIHKVYNGSSTRVRWTGIPGIFEVEVHQPPEPFASSPTPCRIQFFTSAGIREFEIPAPPPRPKPPATLQEQLDEAAERIANCYIYSFLLTMVKALQVFWLGNPPRDEMRVGQHWQIVVHGLGTEDRIRAWNADTRTVLAEVRPFAGGTAEVSIALPPGQAMRALQLTLNDAPFMEAHAYAHEVAQIQGRPSVGPNAVLIRQTLLYHIGDIELEGPADTVVPYGISDRVRFLVHGEGGTRSIDLNPFDPGWDVRVSRVTDAPALQPQLPTRYLTLRRVDLDGRCVTELIAPALQERSLVVARYFGRPWYDAGGIVGKYFGQLDERGTRFLMYVRGATWEAAPDIGDRAGLLKENECRYRR